MAVLGKSPGTRLCCVQEFADATLDRHDGSLLADSDNALSLERYAVQQDNGSAPAEGDVSPDSQERILDFLARHGGAGSTPRREEKLASGDGGWYEVYAADGYRMRCEWSCIGGREEFKFSEVAPRAQAGGRR